MKRLFSSVFVVLLLMNVMGYYGVFLGLQYKNSRDMMLQFDAGTYDETLTRVVKIPFDAPDSLSSEIYERVDADFQKDGEVFRVIKKRLYRDTFHIVYMKDTRGTDLNKALAEVAKTFADQAPDKPQSKTIVPAFIKEYVLKTTVLQTDSFGWQYAMRGETNSIVFIDSYTASIVHPPERV